MRKVAFTLSIIFLVELILGGPGFWSIGGGFSVRKYLFVSSFVLLSIYSVKSGYWCFRFIDAVVFMFLTLSVAIWMFFMPLIRGQSIGMAFADGSALFLLLLYFPLSQLIRKGMINWERVKRLFILLVVTVSFFQLLVWLLVAYNNELAGPVRYAFIYLFHSIGSSSEGLDIYVGYMPDGFYRVMWITSIYFLPAFCFLYVKPNKMMNDYFFLAILVAGIFVSYTRALWLGIAAWFVLFFVGKSLIVHYKEIGRLRFDRVSCLIFSILIGVILLIWWGGQRLFVERIYFTSAGDQGMSIRLYQIKSLLEAWSNHPVFGQGFGSHADYIRAESAPFSYEMVGFALLMKLGVVGILLWIVSTGLVLLYAFQVAWRWGRYRWFLWWMSTSIVFSAVSFTNPYLLNFIGMSIVLSLALEIDWEDRKNNDKMYGVHCNI